MATDRTVPASRVIMITYGPMCGEPPGGINLVSTHRPAGLEPFAPGGALLVVGHVLRGLEHVVAEAREGLPPGHVVVAFRPGHASAGFWRISEWQPLERLRPADAALSPRWLRRPQSTTP